MLQLTFLGTSAGVPTKQRNVTALAIECLNPYLAGAKQHSKKSRPWLLIDCGEGTQQQLLHTKLSLRQLVAICITHVHGDHCYGLPGLLASAAMLGRTEPLTIIAPKAIATLLDAVKLTTELYFPYPINFIAIEELLSEQKEATIASISLDLDKQQQLTIDVTKLSHRVPSHAFGITQTISHRRLDTTKLKAENIAPSQLWGKLQQGEDITTQEGKRLLSADYVHNEQLRTRVVVAGDNDTPMCLVGALQDTDLLVHEATYTAEVLAKIQSRIQSQNPDFDADFDPMHSSAQLVGQFAQGIGLNNLILTHFSARYQSYDDPDSSTANMSDIRINAQSAYQGNLWLAEDFAQYRVTGRSLTTEDKAHSQVEYLGYARES
ncbi:MAG: ribonuclease Z [Psychrobacter sp.]|nr:ribonuclease Z [Psychrobacter sp.]